MVLPGGVGTMDEFFEAITLIQNKKIYSFPLVLIDREYFKPLMHLLESMADDGMIDRSDLDLILLTDSVQEAIDYIDIHAIKKFGLDVRKLPEPIKVLGEKS